MAQFTVHKNKNAKTRKQYPYLVDIQANLLEDLQTRVVIPLTKANTLHKKPLKNLTPVVFIEDEPYLLLTPQLAGIVRSDLGPAVTDINHYRTEIIAALDFLISGI